MELNELGTLSHRESTDEQLVRHLLAPPDLEGGVEALDYWRRRSRQLPWYRIRARREAVRTTVVSERRLGAAIVSQQCTPLEARVTAGALIARTRLARWTRRAGTALAAVTSVVLCLVVLAVAARMLPLHTL